MQNYFPGFGNQSNDVKTVAACKSPDFRDGDSFIYTPSIDFQSEFKKIMKQFYPERHFFAHLTSVTVCCFLS